MDALSAHRTGCPMATLFLSYAREDAERAAQLAKALARNGHKVWWDQHLSGGQAFAEAIEEALKSADYVIVCWSAHAVRSPWVRDEAAHGRDNGRMLPLTIDGSAPPLGFRQFHTIELSGWNGRPGARALRPLLAAIAAPGNENERRTAGGKARLHPALQSPRFARKSAAVAAAVLVIGAAAYMGLADDGGGIAPEVALGEFALVSSELPQAIPEMLSQEFLAAFGAENAVTVIARGAEPASAPFIMDGSVSKIGDGVRFTVNLKNRRSGALVWSQAYEHEAADAVAARQAAVGASQVVRCGLWGAASYPREMTDQALSLYLKWCDEHWSGSTVASAELDAARRVTVAVPDFSFGWSALALATVPLAAETNSEAAKIRTEGMAAARKSMALDAQNPEGYMAIAGLLGPNRFTEREALLEKAIGRRPTECGCERQAYGDFLSSVGRIGEAVEQYERARAMRPLAPFSNVRLAQALYLVGRNDEADKVLNETLERWPNATSLQLLKMKSALWTGRHDEAILVLDHPDLPLTSQQRAALTNAFLALKSGDPARRAGSSRELEGLAVDPRYNDKLLVAVLAALGAREAAVRAAANLVRARGLFDAEVLFEPNLAKASGEPPYARLVQALGLARYWRVARKIPDICRGQTRPDFCPAG